MPGGSVSGNNKVWKKITFPAITTSKIRVVINTAADGYSRLSEVEAWTAASGGGSSANLKWLVTDQLGTPRMVFDQTGDLTVLDQNGNYVRGVIRHDYLPFGEDLAGVGGRTAGLGYVGAKVRQKFTQKERDIETGLDYFGARYFSSTQGRFTGVDPAPIKRRHLINPQDLNRYSYVANNPLAFIDPDGEEKIRVIVRTFILDKTVSMPSAKTLFGMPTPIPTRRTFEGDGRGVGQKGSYRTELVVTIETDPSRTRGSACGRACVSSEGIAGPTREIMSDGSKIERRASGDTLKGTAGYSSDHLLVNINAKGNESNPLVSGSPGITHDINISVQSFGSRDDVIVHVQGDHDGFPGYEVLIQRPEARNNSEQLIVGYNPNDEKENATALFPPMDKKMYATRRIKP